MGYPGLFFVLAAAGCLTAPESRPVPDALPINLAHLEHLSEDVVRGDSALRIVHIYAEAPDYHWVDDPDEGTPAWTTWPGRPCSTCASTN